MFACFTDICVVTNFRCVLFKSLHLLHLCRHKRTLRSVEMFAHFAFVSSQSYRGFFLNVSIFCLVFVLSQTYLGFCLNVCVFYICVVTNLTCVQFHWVDHDQGFCWNDHDRGSVEMFASFTCICVVTNHGVFCLNVRVFCICVVTNVTWVLFNCLFVQHLYRHTPRILCSIQLFFNLYLRCPKHTLCSV